MKDRNVGFVAITVVLIVLTIVAFTLGRVWRNYDQMKITIENIELKQLVSRVPYSPRDKQLLTAKYGIEFSKPLIPLPEKQEEQNDRSKENKPDKAD